ncbi:MAG TPA: thiamine pyrophosphate-requiring protein [Gaiellaceae bacterium]|nr:thiamine pyrophosphate-requiring protein [Gaiellaceae bacterium]
MAQLVADFLVERLRAWGIGRIYGYPGDGINAIIGALDRADGDPELIQVRHEEMAAFMACAHAKFTGELGVCLATSGPGAIHLLNGLYDAKLDHQPVLALVGQQVRSALGSDYQQEVDLANLFKDVAGEFVQVATDPAQVRHLIDRAVRIALSERTVSCLILPNDLAGEPAVASPPRTHGHVFSSVGYSAPRVIPVDSDLREAAQILNDGSRVAMLVGQGALGARGEVIEVAERLNPGVAKAMLGRAAVPDDLPYVTGAIGLLGTRASYELMNHCDTLLMVGSNFPYSEFLPKEGQARGVQIDIDARRLGMRYPMESHLTGDAKETLAALLPLLEQKPASGWREEIEGWVTEWWDVMERRANEPADPLNPQLVVWELSKRLPDRAIITGDAGSSATWLARDLRLRDGMMASLSGTLASMGSGVPYAIAAKFAHPDRPVFALVGDGAMQMNGLNELLTIAKYWRRWSNPKLVIVVFNNRDLNMVTWEQRALQGDPKFEDSQEIPDFPYARFAELAGLHGVRVDDPAAIGGAWDEALSATRPVVLEAIVDPEVPLLPPHISAEQGKNFGKAILHDPDRGHALRQSVRHVLDSITPGR